MTRVLWVTNVPVHPGGVGDASYSSWLDLGAEAFIEADVGHLVLTYPGPPGPLATGSGFTDAGGFSSHSFYGVSRASAVRIIREASVDVVHIHGTESPHSLPFLLAARSLGIPAIVTLQGLLHRIVPQLSSGLWEFGELGAIRAAVETVPSSVHMSWGALRELHIIRSAEFVIGRTSWDRNVTLQINSAAKYFHVDELMRPEFYEARWSGDERGPFFLAQCHYPLKGLHKLLAALPLLNIDERMPREIRVAGRAPSGRRYGDLLRKLESRAPGFKVHHLGPLGADGMVDELASSSLALSMSSMENSSNSISEAMLMGVPVVGSNVGGTPELLKWGSLGTVMDVSSRELVAAAIQSALDFPERTREKAALGRLEALDRHSKRRVVAQIKDVYSCVLGGNDYK